MNITPWTIDRSTIPILDLPTVAVRFNVSGFCGGGAQAVGNPLIKAGVKDKGALPVQGA